MRMGRILPVLLFAALALPASLLRAQPPAPAPAHPTRIAIANPSRIFTDMAETKALRDKLEVRRKNLFAQETQQRDAITALMKQRNDTNPNHPSYRDLSDQIDKAKADLQAWGVATKASVDRDQKWMVKDLYDKIEAAIAEVAQRDGIDLVIADGRQEIPNLEEITPEDLRQRLNTRNVLFSNKGIDISEDVLAVLDKKFALTGAGATPALAPAPSGGAISPAK